MHDGISARNMNLHVVFNMSFRSVELGHEGVRVWLQFLHGEHVFVRTSGSGERSLR